MRGPVQVTLVELSRVRPSPLQFIRGGALMLSVLFDIAGNSESRLDLISALLRGTLSLGEISSMPSSHEVQARMDNITMDGAGKADSLLDGKIVSSLVRQLADEL